MFPTAIFERFYILTPERQNCALGTKEQALSGVYAKSNRPASRDRFNIQDDYLLRGCLPYNWCSATVADILSKQEYCGDTVNFRSTRKSFKNKKKIERPPEDWKIFKDTHPAIIDRAVFDLVQELRKHRRRPTKSGIVSPASNPSPTSICTSWPISLLWRLTWSARYEIASSYRLRLQMSSKKVWYHLVCCRILDYRIFRFVCYLRVPCISIILIILNSTYNR